MALCPLAFALLTISAKVPMQLPFGPVGSGDLEPANRTIPIKAEKLNWMYKISYRRSRVRVTAANHGKTTLRRVHGGKSF
jgi:uncharacterized membrane protein